MIDHPSMRAYFRRVPWARIRFPAIVLAVLLLIAMGGLAIDELRSAGTPDRATVTVVDENETPLGTVHVRVADTFRERYVGLSDTDALGPDEGMLFVHEDAGNYTYVMREMAFPIDIVFIGADGRITVVHHAEVEEPPLTRYRGRAKWVLEVPYHWTTEHGVSAGDMVDIEYG